MDPVGVGNDMRLLVSDMAGRASIELKGRELGFDLSGDRELVTRVTDRVKEMEQRGYTFEAADASFELLLAEEVEGARPSYFDVESWRVITETRPGGEAVSEATVKLRAEGVRYVVTGEGNGPVNALDHALREAIGQAFPEVAKFELIDYKVRILDQGHGTDAITRVLIETTDGESSWVTVGVGANVIEASWGALVDGLTFGLRRQHRWSGALRSAPRRYGRRVLHDLTALEQGDAVRRGEVSPLELVEHYADRADGRRGAFVTRTPDLAREHARRLTEAGRPADAVRSGASRPAIKDLHPTAGRAHHLRLGGVRRLRARGVRRRRRSRSRPPGMVEPRQDQHPGVRLALLHRARRRAARRDAVGHHPHGRRLLGRCRRGRGRRPGARRARAPTAAARSGSPPPAAASSGLKPTRGRISGAPMYGDPVGLATAGTLARTVRDAAALLDVLAGRRRGRPVLGAGRRPSRSSTPATASPGGCGSRASSRRSSPTSTSTRERARPGRTPPGCWSRSATTSRTSPVPIPPEAVAVFETCWAVLTALSPAPPGREDRLRPLTRWLSERGHAVSGPEFGLAIGELRQHAAGALAALAPYDVVLTPTLAPPPVLGRGAARRRRPGRATSTPRRPSRPGPPPGTSPACRRSRCRCTGPTTACRSA